MNEQSIFDANVFDTGFQIPAVCKGVTQCVKLRPTLFQPPSLKRSYIVSHN